MRQIAEACDINGSLLYHYFDDKDYLFRSVLAHAVSQLVAAYDALRNPAAAIDAWLQAQVTLAPRLVKMVKIIADYAALGIRHPEVDGLIAGVYARERKLLQGKLEPGIAQGLLRQVDAAKSARVVGHQPDGIFHASNSRGRRRIAQDMAELRECLWHFVGDMPVSRRQRATAQQASTLGSTRT